MGYLKSSLELGHRIRVVGGGTRIGRESRNPARRTFQQSGPIGLYLLGRAPPSA